MVPWWWILIAAWIGGIIGYFTAGMMFFARKN
jgi:hypothetical protein